ncbi:MAG: hypothetical protein A3B74_01290 [Candidatus Kerfeldbacteria bacterium RIFCSPHIGHO2_02_FULL_42_14]|uniref:Uncharacterized protein n=1 Tax=Candidatus Kerfeldbacteria bacterium RIFCSPHIGHO2_02_FULL_42_14 TaxID=1798540 RepID=A0A1G2ANZ9_9BACT|nr:MAG: hypothetical protein A3B74_01290 [Candidatus Kerfeldbacteria bacterium RIFCSPHIGHO2_02_FULL_42_14]OGY81138.1 MAG: hypothetical protein A3E60_04755 [Candidatus Kerfeldbacteria bacterium RIFCSPHIGHO2_12_FULL_42_13]OGY84219.1 MAG: hypothetical protein A3I91_05485 [Candidatus Kerfeldbacteria bacterium RIFCSPLOWO2_02_FULL_42_19]
MITSKTIVITTLAASFVLLAGCSTQTATNTNANVVNANTTVEVADTTNENTNKKDETGEVNTSDWQFYSNNIYDLSFQYPQNWSIKQEWLEQGQIGEKYNIFLQNEHADSILLFLTTSDFVADEGEGDPLYLTGTIIEDKKDIIEVLKDRGLPIYKTYDVQSKLYNIYYTVETYGGTKLSLLTLFQNESRKFPFFTVHSPLLAGWSDRVSSAEVDSTIQKYESGNLKNQQTINEYIKIVATVRY